MPLLFLARSARYGGPRSLHSWPLLQTPGWRLRQSPARIIHQIARAVVAMPNSIARLDVIGQVRRQRECCRCACTVIALTPNIRTPEYFSVILRITMYWDSRTEREGDDGEMRLIAIS